MGSVENGAAMNEKKAKSYAARFDRVLDYIEQHLDDALDIDQLCKMAHF